MLTVIFVSLAALALYGCGGSNTITLKGTFSDRWDVDNQSGSCPDQLSGVSVTVKVDNVPANSAPVTFSGNPQNIGTTLGGSTVWACTGAWQVTVPNAHISYILGISGLGGDEGTVTIPTGSASGQIRLDDYPENDQGSGGTLERSTS
jgi:hypothetical protein